MKNSKLKSTKGITLIALIVTIIVLLILAGVTIATLTGEHGILTQAEDAKTKTTKEEARERIQLEMLASIGNDGKYNVEKAKQNLKDNLGLTEESGNVVDNGDGTLTVTEKGYEFLVDAEGVVTDPDAGGGNAVVFNPETLEIGTAINTTQYGYKVKDYTVTTTDCPSGVWRLFYQDSNYTYLINDELTATTYKPREHYSSYANGASVSTVGQKLSPKISSLFTESNTDPNIRFTAWMTDPDAWKDYLDPNGDAVFAIGSPTVELFAASYNNRSNKSNIIELELGRYGYIENIGRNWLSTTDNYGIYNKSTSSYWWLASPDYNNSIHGLYVIGYFGSFDYTGSVGNNSYAVRPTVCIPTSVFNSNYSAVAE